jgi:hypothetical protein
MLFYAALVVLGLLGIAVCAVLVIGLAVPKYRLYALSAFAWALLWGFAASVCLAVFVVSVLGSNLRDPGFMPLACKGFFAGFALGALIWYVLRFRSIRRGTAV